MGNEMTTIDRVHMAYSGTTIKTFGLDTRFNIKECEIIEVPKEVYIPSTVKLGFIHGFHFECSPSTLILTKDNGYVEVSSLKKDDKVALFMFSAETGKFIFEESIITTYEYNPILQLQVPAYLFVSQYENLLLPQYNEGSSGIAFIDIKQ
jgi:hypothetical protein